VIPPKDGFAHIPCIITFGCNLFHFKPFKTTFKKERDTIMINKNYIELDNIVVVGWVDNTLDQTFSRKISSQGSKI